MIHHHKPDQPEKTVAPVHNCYCHKYTSDIELSKSASYDQFVSVPSCIQTCIGDVLLWMNTGKTEVMPVGSASCLQLANSVQTLAETVLL